MNASARKLARSQKSALERLLATAARRVPFYRELWRAHGVDVAQLDLPAQLDRLPLVSKAMLAAADVADRLDPVYGESELVKARTSGSTGQPLDVWTDRATRRRRQFRFLRALMAAGYRPGQRLMLISSRSSDSIKRVSPWARLFRWSYADLYWPEGELVRAYRALRPDVLYAPLSVLLFLGREARTAHRPRHVVSTSEQLTPSARAQLEARYCESVSDFFGMTETGLIAWRIGRSSAYSTAQAGFILEMLPAAQQEGPGEARGLERLVVTDLAGGAMPLIRYDTGDLVRRDRTRPGAPIVELAGKQVDFLELPDGTCVSPYTVDGEISELRGLERYEVVQQPDFSVDLRIAAVDPEIRRQARECLARLCRGEVAIRVAPLPVGGSLTSHKLRPIRSLVRRSPAASVAPTAETP